MDQGLGCKKEAEDAGHVPNRRHVSDRPWGEPWVREAYENVRINSGPSTCEIVGGHGLPLSRWFPHQVDKTQVFLIVEATPDIQAYIRHPPMPFVKQPWSEPQTLKPTIAAEWAIKYLADKKIYLDLLKPDVGKTYNNWMSVYSP